jgi:hypothetical protein
MRELAPASRVFCGLLGLVPGGGVEPPRPEGRRILSPLRLPVPPSRLRWRLSEIYSLVHFAQVCHLNLLPHWSRSQCHIPVSFYRGVPPKVKEAA